MKRVLILLVLGFSMLFIGVELLAQSSPTPAPAAVSTPATSSNSFLTQVGGLAGAVSFVVFGLFTILSALRVVLAKYDGVSPGQNTATPDTKLTILNNVCSFLGSVVDFLTGNIQH
jgi:hypothetical protein